MQVKPHPPLSNLQVTMAMFLKFENELLSETRIHFPFKVSPAIKVPFTVGLPRSQLEYWTLVPSYHFIWLAGAGKKNQLEFHRQLARIISVVAKHQSTFHWSVIQHILLGSLNMPSHTKRARLWNGSSCCLMNSFSSAFRIVRITASSSETMTLRG